ncbi:hypothetical protein HPP92_012963 [Vanilla planifolia]|uniref:Myb/SANT-like DNA-binding domain-containing protein n=1 Tax=Vanilla planifolia TaxID=51239 RepID=A0A835UW12_VANPL|nr:hypothetical protein HPP92_012963 [Vanilla planifolia]
MASPASSSSAAGDDGVPSSAAASSIPHLPTSSAASRRLPPPCWSHEETLALIDAYRDKWYSLGRGNLRASHWDEVAAVVARCCPSSPVCKTSVQCRHKVEKLRKRYRSEKQRSLIMALLPEDGRDGAWRCSY